MDVNEENNVKATYTGLGIDWNQRGNSVSYPLDIQAKAVSEYFMVSENYGREVKDVLSYELHRNVKVLA